MNRHSPSRDHSAIVTWVAQLLDPYPSLLGRVVRFDLAACQALARMDTDMIVEAQMAVTAG